MSKSAYHTGKWFHFFLGAGLLTSYFVPWVSWKGITIYGYYLPTGRFFGLSKEHFNFENPFPQLSPGLLLFWLIPVLTLIVLVLIILKRKTISIAYVAGALSLASITIFILFSQTLIDLGNPDTINNMLKTGLYIHLFCAIGFISTAYPVKKIFLSLAWMLAGPLLAYSCYKLGEKYVMAETFKTTDEVKADYRINAADLLKDFSENNKLANEKYRDKIIVVNGPVSRVEQLHDSSTTIQFADSTGSYIAFSFDKDQLDILKDIKPGDPVSLKGSCSGSIYSQILGTTLISFKRSTLNKQKQP